MVHGGVDARGRRVQLSRTVRVDTKREAERALRAFVGEVEAGVVALDAESTVETVADGMAAHPTLSEAIKEAGLVALGRAIHLPNKKKREPAQA